MIKYVIDGLFLTQRMTGIQRYAYELTLELDKIVQPDGIEIVIPQKAKISVDYKNIKVVRYGKLNGIPWQQLDYAWYVRKKKAKCICLTNAFPLLYTSGFVTIHDICYKVNPSFFKSFRDHLSALLHRLYYWRAAHSRMNILTDSFFSKSELEKYYKISDERITVLYCGWQHMNRIIAAEDTFERYPFLEKKDFFFSMSTLGANKNFKWLLYAANNNPTQKFAIAGGGDLKGAGETEGFVSLPNVFFLGYVTDQDAKSLMKNCKAFIFPTLYEGFGLTPLEAISCGAPRIVVSDTPCMHEIYGNFAEYINPTDYVNATIEEKTKNIGNDRILSKYSWFLSAHKFKEILEC